MGLLKPDPLCNSCGVDFAPTFYGDDLCVRCGGGEVMRGSEELCQICFRLVAKVTVKNSVCQDCREKGRTRKIMPIKNKKEDALVKTTQEGEGVSIEVKDPCGYMVYERSDPRSTTFIPSLRNGHWAIHPTLIAGREAAIYALAEANKLEIPYTAKDIAILIIYRDRASGVIYIHEAIEEQRIRDKEWDEDSTGTYD